MAIVIYKIYNLLYYGGSHRKTHRTPKIKGINKKKTAENSRKPRIISDFPKSNKFILERSEHCPERTNHN